MHLSMAPRRLSINPRPFAIHFVVILQLHLYPAGTEVVMKHYTLDDRIRIQRGLTINLYNGTLCQDIFSGIYREH